MVAVDIHIELDNYNIPSKVCNGIENVKSVNYDYIGRVSRVVCQTNIVYEDFEEFEELP